MPEAFVPSAWLYQQVSLEEIEKSADLPVPADSAAWTAFLAQMRPGDQLWYFISPPDTWRHLAGRLGYVILRAGQQVAQMIIMMN
ncbi:MAG TPA: hypothetical protein VKT32_14895 [Chthonomonadaceae bacterium]|nr:hypothetical protein [Chthonomonadaceae bacterium]